MFESITSSTGSIIVTTMAILAVLNPFGNMPQFLEMSSGLDQKNRLKLFWIITLTAFIIVITFLFIGPVIMEHLFRIHIADLRVAGGLTLVVMGIYGLLFPVQDTHELTETETPDEFIKHHILPMAFPMLVGPGTLSTVVVFASDVGMVATFAGTSIAFAIILALFMVGPFIERLTGQLVLFVTARIMKVFIIAIGVRMFISGGAEILGITLNY